MNPWENPAYFFEGEYCVHPGDYYFRLNLRFGGYPPAGTEEIGVRYIDMDALNAVQVKPADRIDPPRVAATVNVRFRVRLPGECPNSGFDDCYHSEGHPESTGESSVDIPIRILRRLAMEQSATLPPQLQS